MRSPPRIFLYQLANIKKGTIMAAYIIPVLPEHLATLTILIERSCMLYFYVLL